MKNIEWIKTATAKQIGRELCDITDCESCPVIEKCVVGHNGFVKWLEEEHEDD